MITCEMNNLEKEWSLLFSPDVIFCGWLGSEYQLINWLTNSLQRSCENYIRNFGVSLREINRQEKKYIPSKNTVSST